MRTLLLFTILTIPVPVAAQTHADRSSDISLTIQRAVAFHPAIRAAAARNALDPHLLWTIAYLETRFRPQLVSHKGARGLMQFIPATGRRYGLLPPSDLHHPLRSSDAAAGDCQDPQLLVCGSWSPTSNSPTPTGRLLHQSFGTTLSTCSLGNPLHPLHLLSPVSRTYSRHLPRHVAASTSSIVLSPR